MGAAAGGGGIGAEGRRGASTGAGVRPGYHAMMGGPVPALLPASGTSDGWHVPAVLVCTAKMCARARERERAVASLCGYPAVLRRAQFLLRGLSWRTQGGTPGHALAVGAKQRGVGARWRHVEPGFLLTHQSCMPGALWFLSRQCVTPTSKGKGPEVPDHRLCTITWAFLGPGGGPYACDTVRMGLRDGRVAKCAVTMAKCQAGLQPPQLLPSSKVQSYTTTPSLPSTVKGQQMCNLLIPRPTTATP